VILETILELVTCGPCVRQYGRWTNQVVPSDDGAGASLWNDLTLFNYSRRDKTKQVPSIPKVVELLQDSDRDISTICDLQHHHQQYRLIHVPSEKECTIVLRSRYEMIVDDKDDIDSIIFAADDDDDGTTSLESLLGPRTSRRLMMIQQHGCRNRTVGPHGQSQHEQHQQLKHHRLHRYPPCTKTTNEIDDGSSYSSTCWMRPSSSVLNHSCRRIIFTTPNKRL
jgi:hypothetical protein